MLGSSVLSIQDVIAIRLRDMMEAHRARTGEPLTYGALAERSGVSRFALESMASRPGYNASLDAIERVCRALHCTPGDLLELRPAESSPVEL